MSSNVSVKKIFEYIHKAKLNKLELIITQKDFDARVVLLRSSQDTGLHIAVRTGNTLLMEWLLDNGFNIFLEHQNIDGKRPLHEAAQLCFLELVDLLLRKGAEVDPLKRADWTPLMLAAAKGNHEIIQRLIKAGASPNLFNKDGWTPFHIACRTGETNVVKYFFTLKEDIWNSKSKNGRTPLHTAALHGNTEVVSLLFEKAHYPDDETDSCGNTPLMEAVRSGHLDCVHLFLTRNPQSLQKVDQVGRTIIHLAVEAGQVDIVHSLIKECEVEVNSLSKNGETPLHFAAKENHINMIELLISLGVLINHQDFKGRTALWMAASSKKIESFNALTLHGAEDIPDLDGKHPSLLIH